jgi:vitamin B12 transporter
MRFRRRLVSRWHGDRSFLLSRVTISMLNRHIHVSMSAVHAGVFSIVLAATAAGQTAPHDEVVELDDFVVSATRTPQDPQFVTSSFGVLPLSRLDQLQIPDLRTALATLPGVNIVNTGAPGGQTSIFIRGAASKQTLLVVDGIPMNSRAADYSNYLGSADLVGVDRVEVLRGPQSTLWGSSAMGGAVFIDSTRGCGPATGSVQAGYGSFDTATGSAAVKGGTEKIGYSASVGLFRTDNDHPHNGSDSWSTSTRVEGTPLKELLVGGTFRGQQAESDLYVYGPANTKSANYLATVYAQWALDKEFSSRLTLGDHQRRYTYNDTGAYPYSSELRDRRNVADWQNTWYDLHGVELVAGATGERSYHRSNSTAGTDDNGAGYLSGTVHPTKESTVNAGLRYDNFDTFGSAWTWRAGAAWNPSPATKLHTSVGTGFTAPSHEDREGNPAWGQNPNHNLQPEKSTGWDVGIDQKLGSVAKAGLTYFQTYYRDRIQWVTLNPNTYVGQMQNISRARSDGIEFSLSADPAKYLHCQIAYTYLEAKNTTAGVRLARQPRHSVDAEVSTEPLHRWIVGAGLRIVADRVEFTGVPNEDYTTVRFFTSYEVAKNLLLKARVENALDEKYQEAAGFDALPFGAFGGVEYKF